MLRSYLYILIQMLLVLICMNCIYTAHRHWPAKLRVSVIVALIFELLRLASNIILFASDNIVFLYILKYFEFLNLTSIPIMAIISLYIFYRSDSVKFYYVIIVSVVLFSVCIYLIVGMDYYIERTQQYGYCIYLVNNTYIKLFQMLLLSFFLICGILALGRKVANNKGLMLIIAASSISMGEIVLTTFNFQILCNQIIGDIVWIIVMQYALNTMEQSKSR